MWRKAGWGRLGEVYPLPATARAPAEAVVLQDQFPLPPFVQAQEKLVGRPGRGQPGDEATKAEKHPQPIVRVPAQKGQGHQEHPCQIPDVIRVGITMVNQPLTIRR